MNSLKRKPEIIFISGPDAVVIGRNLRRSMRNNSDIIERWKRRQERQRIHKQILKNGIAHNKRKI